MTPHIQAGSTVTTESGAHFPANIPTTPEREALWQVERALWAPRTFTVRSRDGEVLAAALTAGRPYSAYRKIVDVIACDDASFAMVVSAAASSDGRENSSETRGSAASPVATDAARPVPLVIRFEEHVALAPLSAEREQVLRYLGFTADAVPMPSVPSTLAGTPEYTRSWSLWHDGHPATPVPYYGQTTDVTCGAVTALMMFQRDGIGEFTGDSTSNHTRELAFWRRATNLPACDPIGLAVTTAEDLASRSSTASRAPRVIISTDDPVLLEDFVSDIYETRLRTQLQQESRRQAEHLGVAIETRWITAEEIRNIVAAGSDVFLLIALDPLIGDPSPHWVLAHEARGDHLIVSDPWVEQAHGESWVDTSGVPIPLKTIDLITRWGNPEYRSVVVVPRG